MTLIGIYKGYDCYKITKEEWMKDKINDSKYIKKVKIKNYSSLFALVILSTLAAVIQSEYPSLLLCASTDTFVMYIAYLNMRKRTALESGK